MQQRQQQRCVALLHTPSYQGCGPRLTHTPCQSGPPHAGRQPCDASSSEPSGSQPRKRRRTAKQPELQAEEEQQREMQPPPLPNQSFASRQEQEEAREVKRWLPGADRRAAAEKPPARQQEARQGQQAQQQERRPAAIAAAPGPIGELDRRAALHVAMPIIRRASITGAANFVSGLVLEAGRVIDQEGRVQADCSCVHT